MRRDPDNHHLIHSLRQLRHARERIDWHLGVAEDNIRRDYRHIVDLWSVKNIARLATGHLEQLQEVIGMVRDGYASVREFIKKRKTEPEKGEGRKENGTRRKEKGERRPENKK